MKEEVCQSVLEILEQKIKTVKKSVSSIQEARNNETKSTAGDKYETGRAMMQAELEKQTLILRQYQNQRVDILKVKNTKSSEEVDFGSLVITNQGNYLIAIGIGKIDKTFVISLASPLGSAFRGLKSGDKVVFQNKEYRIINVK